MFDPHEELDWLRAEREIRRKNGRLYSSRLDQFSFEILEMRKIGATASEIQYWLRNACRTKVSLSTVTRWLKKHE